MLLLGVVQEQAISVAPVGEVGSYDLLATEILTTTTASITFDVSGLGSTYKHLQIRSTAKASETANDYWAIAMRYNSDSGTNYSSHRIMGNGSTVASSANVSSTYVYGGLVTNSYGSNPFAGSVVDILDFASSTKNKTSRSFHAVTGALFRLSLESGAWYNTNPITSITLSHSNASSFIAGSRFSIYGIKAS